MSDQQVEKNVVEITESATIVYANADIDTLITISEKGLQWWFKGESDKYDLVDTFAIRIDLKTATIADARQLAEEWFITSLRIDSTDDGYDPVKYEASTPIEYKSVGLKKVVPGFRQVKDAHTEHCCLEHKRCFYNKTKCSVILGRKLPSYPCRCKHD